MLNHRQKLFIVIAGWKIEINLGGNKMSEVLSKGKAAKKASYKLMNATDRRKK